MRTHRPIVLTLLLGMTAGPMAGAADVVTIGASQDNTIFSENGASSNGAGDHFFAGRTKDGFLRRGLLAFDVDAAVPAGSQINSVTLTLHLSRTRTGNQNVSLYRVLSDWGEGTSHASGEEGTGSAAATHDATWTHRKYPSLVWSSAGGDFAATARATSVVSNQTGFYTWSSASMVADVQAWLNGTQPEYGWIVRSNETDTRVVKRFDSRTNPTTARRPMLTVDFTPPAATGACCATDGSCSVVLDPGSSCSGTYQGSDSLCTPNPCPQPTGACCLPDAAATCQAESEGNCTGLGGTFQGAFSSCVTAQCPVVLTPFLDPLPIPAVATPVIGFSGGSATYVISMREVQQQLHAQLPPTTVWGWGTGASGASSPGPTIEAAVGKSVTVNWVNDLRNTSAGGNPPPLRTTHYLPVDTCPHGALANADARTVVHLHGAHVQSAFDGHPDATYPPGQFAAYTYPNWQLPATLWYHDHALGITRLNVYMGLAGFYLLRDAYEKSLPLPSGEFEIPLAIQDRSFNPDGSLQYPAWWQEVFFANTILVNGKAWPYLNVKKGKYRFRLLNGSTSRTYALTLSNGASFQQIGAEGGLLPAPVTLNKITLGPGERADAIVNFAPYSTNTEIVLRNSAPAPFPGEPGVGVVPNVMKFIVTNQTGYTAALPATLRPMEVLQEADATQFREFHLEKGPGDACSPFLWFIRSVVGGTVVGEHWEDLTEFPELGDTEVWKFVNKSGMTHPMHMHLVMFQVLDRQAFEVVGGNIVPIGSPVPPPPHEAGWKDTVQVGPNEIVRVIARFENYAGLFPYHCHILEHEDHEMMRQFQSVATVPACQDGIDNDGDGRTDFAGGDPGCSSASDLGERAAHLACDDGIDNDGDGRADFELVTFNDGANGWSAGGGDRGCAGPGSFSESPHCQDGIDNDAATNDPEKAGTDWDGGLDAGRPPDPAGADPNCAQPYRDCERVSCGGCGLGFELVLLLPALLWLHRRRRGT